MVLGCLLLAIPAGVAQKNPAPNTPDAARAVLIRNAHAMELRERPDMAVQLWQQILLSDPKNTEALAGLARDYKLMGAADKSAQTLDRLREISPNDPNIPMIQALSSTKGQSEQLRQAGELARQGHTEEAMRIFRSIYGDHPPDGDIALAYYQTLYGTAGGKETAIAAMRALAERNPGDTRYAVALGSMLTYSPKTRAEGIRILRQHPRELDAQTALRQALIWDAANPASAAQLREYLKDHPQDTEVATLLKQDEAKLAQMNSGIARTPAERAAFAALNARKLDEAEARFTELLQQDPNNGRVLAGMGFLRMQQGNFGGAIGYLTQAGQNGYKDKTVEDGLAASRFWYTMGEATQAFDENRVDEAAAKFRAALAARPRSPEALIGLAGLLTKERQYAAAAQTYEQLLKVQPGSVDASRGLFLAYARDGQNQKALAAAARFPATVKTALAKDPEYLRTLATIYRAQNRGEDAQRTLSQALALPFPANGSTLKTETRLQYAGILMEAKRYDQAAAMYAQILNDDAANLSAWMGIVDAHHQLGQDNEAIADLQKMPPAAYEAALADPGFLSMLGAIYQQANQFEIAQGFLERSARMQIAAGGQPGIDLQLQLAAIYLERNNTAQAYQIYTRILSSNPDRVDAWKGLIATLQVTNRNSEALQEIAQIPAPVRKQLETDIEFLQSEASLYAASGDTVHAIEYMNRVEAHYSAAKTLPPANIEVQNAWLLFNTRNDRLLYQALMRLGGRQDLTVAQRETIQDIWANWSVRRAAAAMDNGNLRRAVDILDAASQAFPDNLAVRKAVAGGYAQVGRAKESLALFKTVPLQDATSGDFQGAINAALAANDKAQAEIWLRQALDRYPRDPAILSLAARYEQARGDNQRAADFWRASLAAMPQVSPAARLAHTLVYPEQDTRSRRAVTAADLQQLLDPSNEPFAKTTKIAPLPAYGADPYNGPAPVVMDESNLSQPTPKPTGWIAPSSGNGVPGPYAQPANIAAANPAKASSVPASSPNLSAFMGVMRLPASEQSVPSALPLPSSPSSSGKRAQSSMQQAVQPPHDLVAQPVPQAQTNSQPPPGPVVHTLAGDAWKGLIFSLLAGNRNDEALKEIAQIPPEVRKDLEADIDFEQAQASLYAALGDLPRAHEYLNRVENYYLLRRAAPPAGIELEYAWLLFNNRDDRGLYPVLQRLDLRQDLTAAQQLDVQTIWGNWAARQAATAMDSGNIRRAIQILEAAALEFPSNLTVRRAVAGGYAKVGRAAEALTLYKAIPMQDASSGELEGAVGAALAAKDMAQAEAWLRQALERYPHDPAILATAARFEQAVGNNARATDFWRSALAAMPPGASVERLDSGLAYPEGSTGSRSAPQLGDLKRLLDPAAGPLQKTAGSPSLPAFNPQSWNRAPLGTSLPVSAAPHPNDWVNPPSGNPLPLPVPALPNPATASPPHRTPPSQPVLIEQSATRDAVLRPATDRAAESKPISNPSGGASAASSPSVPPAFTGRMNLPAAEENIDSIGPLSSANGSQAPNSPPRSTSQAVPAARSPSAAAGLRISSQPMDRMAAQVQALFADQTDSQLTQGSAAQIHAIPNAPAGQPSPLTAAPSAEARYAVAQYTPSAQEAASGAYSAPRQATPTPPPETGQPAPPKPSAAKKKRKKDTGVAAQPAPQTPAAPTLESAPAQGQSPAQQNPPQVQIPAETPAPPPPPASGTGLSDEELQQRNLPPLRGPWVRVQREQRAISPRDEAEMQLRSIESGYSAWIGGAGIVNYRSGAPGYDQLIALEAPFEASVPLGFHARLTFVGKPVFLDSGQADGTAVVNVQESTTAGTKVVTIPQPIGTLTTTDVTPPAQQNATGIGGELQLAFRDLALAGGYTPYGFLIATFTGRAQFRPGNGPISFNFSRDPVRDTQLSYAGLRDPNGNSLGSVGQIWGGVMANQGNVQFTKGGAESGFYFNGGVQYLAGYNVETNTRADLSGGAYWRAHTSPEYGSLSIGTNFFAMRYSHNERAFTFGMGGYFSPQVYFLANVPFTWNGHSGTRWHYNVLGSLGVQAFQEDATPIFPLAAQAASEIALNNAALPAQTVVGPNYDARAQVAYQIGSHWFAGGFLSANNSRNYNSASAGFSIRFLFREQPSTAAGPTGLFPTDGLRPFRVP